VPAGRYDVTVGASAVAPRISGTAKVTGQTLKP
jgi:hypothetical protein